MFLLQHLFILYFTNTSLIFKLTDFQFLLKYRCFPCNIGLPYSVAAPCSPGQGHSVHKHIRGTIRMSSMELPDENEKSYSSASTSPCPSPHANNQNHMNPLGKRVLPPNNLYVALYNFDARHRDELDLK